MIGKIRERLLAFIESDKDVPLLAGLSVGFYILLFYYSRNFALAYSWHQFLFFAGYFVVLPVVALFTGYKLLRVLKLQKWQKHFLFTGMIAFFTLFLLQINYTIEHKKIILPAIIIVGGLLSLKFGRYYKLFILLLVFMSVFNIKPLAGIAYRTMSLTDDWKQLPDDIEQAVFKAKPNIYYIQPDGYTSFENLRENKHYDFDNSQYEAFLKNNGFTLYDDYRSNYYSTLLSNSATFAMKQHYLQSDVEMYGARDIIAGNNPVIRILKKNGYKTSFITETPYIIMSRPRLGFDFCNISYDEIPYFGDGFYAVEKNVEADLKKQMALNGKSGNFYFVEKFLPGHVSSFEANSEGAKAERDQYIKKLGESNTWLKDLVSHIAKNDPDAVIIIGADHGGFAGLDYTMQTTKRLTDESLIRSVYGAQLAIKWNDSSAAEYDKDLTTGVNLFRTVFSYLSQDKKYLSHKEENASYIKLKEPRGIYRYIDGNGKIVFEQR